MILSLIARSTLAAFPALFAPSIAGSAGTAQDLNPFSTSEICRYGLHLFNQGEWGPASDELARCIFLDSTSLTAGVLPKLLEARLRAGHPEEAFRLYQKSIPASMAEASHLKLSLGRSLMLAGKDSLAVQLLLPDAVVDTSSGKMALLRSAAWLRMGRTGKALSDINASRPLPLEWEPARTELSGMIQQVESARGRKNPFLSALLSTFSPGLGKIYCGQWADGAVSAVALAFFVWQGVDGFQHDGVLSPKGVIFSGAGAGLYFGTIFGSWRAARTHNEKREKEISDHIRFIIEFKLP